jgi:hypothetical protein
MHHTISIKWNQRDAFVIQFIDHQSLYMFRALLAHPQEVLHKQHLVYCISIISVGCVTVAVKQCHSQLTLYARIIPNVFCVAPTEDKQVMLETCRGLDVQQTDWKVHHVGFVILILRFIALLMRNRYSFFSRTRIIKSTNSKTPVQHKFKYYFPLCVQITNVSPVIQIFLIWFWTHYTSLYISGTSHPTWLHLPNDV